MKVTVFSTKGRKRSEVESSATTWGELKKDLASAGVETSGMKAIIGENQNTLESAKAALPVDFDFTLFLTPVKVKSGANLDYKTCKVEIKKAIEANESNRVFFPRYTTSSTSAMNKMLKKYYKATIVEDEVVEEIEETVEQACDVVIQNLETIVSQVAAIRDKAVEGNATIAEEDLVKGLEAQFAEIQSNL